MIKMNKSNNNKIETINCPVCGFYTEVERLIELKIDSKVTELHGDVGFIIQCVNPDCAVYLEKINDEFKLITKRKLIERQLEITDFLVKDAELSRIKLVPTAVEAERAKIEAGRVLSPTLYTLTAESIYRRAYTVDEILEACSTMGFHPSTVDNSTIPYVVAWLEEHKGT